MNYVKALFNKLYKSGFVDEPKNQKNAIAAILLLHEFYKAKCMDKEMFNKSSKMIQDKVFEKGLSYEFQLMVINNQLTSEDAIIEMGIANGNIEIEMDEDRGEIEPIIDNDIINVNQLNKG